MKQKHRRSYGARLGFALDALQEINPANLRIVADLIRQVDADLGATIGSELERYADLIDGLREEKPAEAWSPFVQATLSADPEIRQRLMDVTQSDEIWLNNKYQVALKWDYLHSAPGDKRQAVRHLSIKRIDRAPLHDWRDLQRIKDELCGPEAEGLEIYPAESRLVDTSNQYHIWVLPAGARLGMGYDRRCIMEAEDFGVRQRPFSDPDVKAEAARNYQQLLDGTLDGADAMKTYLDVKREQESTR